MSILSYLLILLLFTNTVPFTRICQPSGILNPGGSIRKKLGKFFGNFPISSKVLEIWPIRPLNVENY